MFVPPPCFTVRLVSLRWCTKCSPFLSHLIRGTSSTCSLCPVHGSWQTSDCQTSLWRQEYFCQQTIPPISIVTKGLSAVSLNYFLRNSVSSFKPLHSFPPDPSAVFFGLQDAFCSHMFFNKPLRPSQSSRINTEIRLHRQRINALTNWMVSEGNWLNWVLLGVSK